METNATVGNFLAMCERVSQVIHAKPEHLSPGAKLTAFLQTFDTKVARLRDIGGERSRLEKAPAKAKLNDKTTVEGMRQLLADALTIHANDA